ncbi:MAG: RagB/SusD family nutrient uptake outer membrane protein [Bacteroidota bacterium]|nr:RagB/SusD family nutrient uptake outer membrane protein [Bacteroidota bacterium]
MKFTAFKIFFVAIFIAMLSSCEGYLDPGYDQTLTKSDVFSSYVYALNYVRTIYSYLPSGAFDETFMTDESKHTDEASPFLIMNNGSWTSRTYVGSWTWGHYYAGIRRVHIFLENVDKAMFLDDNTYKLTPSVNDTLRKQLRGEARFLRAFYYFELLKRFGDPSKNLGIPIVPEKVLTINDTLDFARNKYDECVNYIVSDCDNAAAVLPVRRGGSDYGKASKAAALALKSRVLLYAASPLANPSGDVEKWKLAADAANDVIKLAAVVPVGSKSPTYKLTDKATVSNDNMLSVFTTPDNDEVLFSSPVVQSNGFEASNLPPSLGGGGQINPTQDLVDAFESLTGYPITDPKSGYNPTNPYYRRDKRLAYFIALNGSQYGVAVKDETPAQLAARTLDTYVGGKDGFNSSKNATKTGYYVRKFVDPNADIILNRKTATHFWVHFRYAEILLNYAEALAEIGNISAAYDALKLIRDRAGLATPSALKSLSKDDFLERVRNERRVELCFEGHRFWDVRRWKQGETYFNAPIHGMKITKNGTTFTYEVFKVEDRVFDSKMYAMPLPYDEMQKSKLLKQNSGWE